MGSFIESLELRRLLYSAPSVAALAAEGKTIQGDLVEIGKEGKSNFKLIFADLKAAGESKTSGSLLKTLAHDATEKFGVLSRALKGTKTQINSDVKKLLAAAAPLRKHPTDDSLAAKVTAAANKLQTDAGQDLTTILAAVTDEHDTNALNLTAIEDANSGNTQLASDVANTIAPESASARDALKANATTALTTDITNVIDAFPA